MTLTLITARQNEGKTLLCSHFAFLACLRNKLIYSNTAFNFPHYLFNKDFLKHLVKNGIRLPNITWILDEAWLWMDSRSRDTILSYFYLQSSKDNADIYFTAQTDRQIDIRLKENLHYWIECERMIYIENKFIPLPKEYRDKRKDIPIELQKRLFIHYIKKIPINSRTIFSGENFIKDSEAYLYAMPCFKLFDTTSKIKLEI